MVGLKLSAEEIRVLRTALVVSTKEFERHAAGDILDDAGRDQFKGQAAATRALELKLFVGELDELIGECITEEKAEKIKTPDESLIAQYELPTVRAYPTSTATCTSCEKMFVYLRFSGTLCPNCDVRRLEHDHGYDAARKLIKSYRSAGFKGAL